MIKEGRVTQIRRLKNIEFIICFYIDLSKGYETFQINNSNKTETCCVKPGDYIVAEVMPVHKQISNLVEFNLVKIATLTTGEVPIPYGLNTEVNQSTINNNRVFHLRTPEFSKRFFEYSQIKHKLIKYLIENFWVSIESPKIQDLSAESGGSELFAVNYYNKIKYLSQSPQFYKQILANIYGRVYEIGAIYRAESSDTPRHLSQATCLDLEMTTTKLTELYAIVTALFKQVTDYQIPIFEEIPVYSYTELCQKLNKTDEEDFSSEQLEALTKDLPLLYIIEKYPAKIKPFYIKKTEDLKYSYSFDVYYGKLQLASGGLRQQNWKILSQQAEDKGLNILKMQWYFDNFRYGCRPHGGFSIGLARLAKALLNVPDIRNMVLFPLTYGNK